MAANLKDLGKSLLALPKQARAELASVLIESLDDASAENYAAAWLEESARRLEAYETGKLEVIPAEKVIAEARALVGR